MKCLPYNISTHLMAKANSMLIWATMIVPFEVVELQAVFNMLRQEGVKLQAMSVSHYAHDTSSLQTSASTYVATVTTDALQNSTS
jgi:hypothetical protein